MIFGVACLAAVAFIWLMAWGIYNKVAVTSMSGFTRVGEPAPDFTLQLLSGGEIEMSELEGRPIVINFWNPLCTPCRDEALGLERAWKAYSDKGVVFIGIDTPMMPDSKEMAISYVEEFGITYLNGRDIDGRITVGYGVIGLPVTFFVGNNGIVQKHWVGSIPEDRLLMWVDSLASGGMLSEEIEGENSGSYYQPETEG